MIEFKVVQRRLVMNRERLIKEAIHSGEMEGAYVSAEFKKDADQFIKHEISIEDLMNRTRKRWSNKDLREAANAN